MQFILFIHSYLNGDYGEDYGTIDPAHLLLSLKRFYTTTILSLLKRKEEEAYKKKQEEENKNAITYEQWQKIKKQRNENHTNNK